MRPVEEWPITMQNAFLGPHRQERALQAGLLPGHLLSTWLIAPVCRPNGHEHPYLREQASAVHMATIEDWGNGKFDGEKQAWCMDMWSMTQSRHGTAAL